MFTQNEAVFKRVHQDTMDRAYREAEQFRALREAGLVKPSRAAQFVCRSVGALGRLLVNLGQRLERVEATSQRAFSSQAHFGSA